MRDKRTIDWPSLLPDVTASINGTYSDFLGMTPKEANSSIKDPEIREKWEQKKKNDQVIQSPNLTKWKVGDFVYKKLKSSPLYKGYTM